MRSSRCFPTEKLGDILEDLVYLKNGGGLLLDGWFIAVWRRGGQEKKRSQLAVDEIEILECLFDLFESI